jgi:uncharacterized membrane protein YgdD (TMEM256/DUF423 family)
MSAPRLWLFLAGLMGLTAVMAGAYGAHGLAGADALQDAFNTGVQYHMVHALALLGCAWLATRPEIADPRLVAGAGAAFIAGIVLFSGTLYWFGVSGEILVAGAAPAGGVMLMAGWALLALSAIGGRAGSR